MSRLRRSLVLPAIVALALPAASQGAPASTDLDTLAAALVRAPMAELGTSPCSIEVAAPGLAPATASCAEAAGSSSASGAGSVPGLRARSVINTPRWFADIAPLGGGGLARVHGYGDVAVHRPDGEVGWARSGMSFYEEWGHDPFMVPIVPMGVSPIDPFIIASERPFAVGDLTGDGTADIAVSHFVRLLNPGGQTTNGRSFVTILDGADGATRWFREYPGYVTQLLVHVGTLLVGNETGDVKPAQGIGQNGSTTSVRSIAFEVQDGVLTATGESAVLETGIGWARLLAMEPAGDGVAIGYTSKLVGQPGDGGRVRFQGLSGGSAVLWDVPTTGYPRSLRYDASRDRVTVAEQADPQTDANRRQSYWITGLTIDSGTIAARINRTGAALVSFEIGDVSAGPEPEWITGDLQQLPQTPSGALSTTYQAMRVMAADGANPTTLWTHSVQMPSEFVNGRGSGLASWPTPFGLAVVDRGVAVGTAHVFGDGLRVLDGATGTMRWEKYGNAAYPLFLQPFQVGGQHSVLVVTPSKVLRAYSMSSGEILRDVPILADIYHALGFQVDGDGVGDLLVGGESGAIFALDGTGLADDPRVLWRTAVGTGIRRVELGDLDADGDVELVVAATSAVAALDPVTGDLLWTRSLPGNYQWTFALGELDGQPGLDLIVPEHNLWALRGRDGVTLWDHAPDPTHYFSNPVITPDGMVVAQAVLEFPSPLGTTHHRLMIGLDARTGDLVWERPHVSRFATTRLWYTVTAAGPTADGQGTRVAGTWQPGGGAISSAESGITTDIHDSRTGEVLVTHPPEEQGVVPMQTTYHQGRGLFEVNWKTVQQLEPQSTEVVWEATSDIGWADFGERGEAFVRAFESVWLYEADAPMGSQGLDHPAPLAEYDDLFVGSVEMHDLDGDGADEVIATMFDWPGYTQVAAWAGVGVSLAETLPHGIAVLEAA